MRSPPFHRPGAGQIFQVVTDAPAPAARWSCARVRQVWPSLDLREPRAYVPPAVAVGDRALVIDFAPKGGPRDFTAVLDGKTGIKFLRDGNRWPRIDK